MSEAGATPRVFLIARFDNDVRGRISLSCRACLESRNALAGSWNEVSEDSWVNRARRKARSLLFRGTEAANELRPRHLCEKLWRRVETARPDILLVLFGESAPLPFLEQCRRAGITTVQWFFDSCLREARRPFLQNIAGAYDLIAVIDDADAVRASPLAGAPTISLPLGVDTTVYFPRPVQRDARIPVAFVGTVMGKRAEMLERLVEFGLRIWAPRLSWGREWVEPGSPSASCWQGGQTHGDGAARVYSAADIVVDMHSEFGLGGVIANVTPRVFEVPACGGFLLTNDCAQVHRLFRVGEEMVVYRDLDDLVEKVRYYLAHPEERQAIALRARDRVLREHRLDRRIDSLINAAADIKKP